MITKIIIGASTAGNVLFLATKMVSTETRERQTLVGYDYHQSSMQVCLCNPEKNKSALLPKQWRCLLTRDFHRHIIDHWDTIVSGDVIDVNQCQQEISLGE